MSQANASFAAKTYLPPASHRPLHVESERLGQGKDNPLDPGRYFAREGVDPLAYGFAGKIAIHPGFNGEKVDAADVEAVLAPLLFTSRDRTSVAYIHVPFCETHCLYCGFYSLGYRREESRIYTNAVIKELQLWADKPVQQGGPIHAVYLGGGTPTALEAVDLQRLLEAVRQYLPLANDCEITVEGRLSNFGEDKMEACLAGGANRFSLGVQTFDTAIRRRMGRIAPREVAAKRLETLLAYDQAAVIIDLIYGFPGQSMEVWLEDIAVAQSLNLDGADLYQLNIYKSSPLGKAIEAGKLAAGADIPTQSGMFAAGVAAMEKAFYRRLSMSHWSRTTRERNFYNQYVKGRAHCLAYGPGAGGNIDGAFYMNDFNYQSWQEKVLAGRKPVGMLMRPHRLTPLVKGVIESLEQGRLSPKRLEQEFSVPLARIWEPLLSQWRRAGMMEKRDDDFVLTLAGQFWQVNLSQLLLDYLKHSVGE